MPIIDVVKYDGPPNVLVWKHPTGDLTWGTQVIVGPAQEAIFVKGGRIADVLPPGTHTLKTANLPLLRGLVEIPFGGQTPFAAEVYFVSKAAHLDVKWGTTNPMPLLDPVYKVPLPVRAFGQFGIKVADVRLVFTQLSATRREFTVEALAELFKGLLMTRIKDLVAETMLKQKVSLFEVAGSLDEVSESLTGKIGAEFGKYGVEVLNFFVSSIDVPEDDETVKRIKKTLADKADLEILGDGYRTKRTFDTLEKAAGNEGGGAGTGMGLGMGLGAGAGVGGIMAGIIGQASTKPATTACPSCRAENASAARFCASCGKALSASACVKCKAEVPAGTKFCPACGEKAG